MSNIHFKGRKKGSINATIIKDPLLEPFFIYKDENGFTVKETCEVNTVKGEKSSKVVSVAYYSSFGRALKKITLELLNKDHKTYESIKSYVEDWKEISQSLLNITNPITQKIEEKV